VRELQNVIEHMVVLLDPGAEIRPEDIPSLGDRPIEEVRAWTPPEVTTDEPYHAARDRLVAEFELHYLTQLLTQAGGNMSRAARVAGIDRTTLYRLLERHGLDRKGDRGQELSTGQDKPLL
jgi:DNA-binding NtrC family response regulator